jgi:hypothetical protein
MMALVFIMAMIIRGGLMVEAIPAVVGVVALML